jgi:hypothetical protein
MGAMIVRRGLDPSYYFFTEITVKANGMTLIVDRRHRERRLEGWHARIERRTDDRRTEPPVSWTREGVMVIDR